MPSEIEQYREKLNKAIEELNKQAADILARRIAAAFTIGFRATKTEAKISELQQRTINKIAAENLGYITEFNQALGSQLEAHLKEVVAVGGGYEDVKRNMKPYIEEVFGYNGAVTIDRTGQTRQVIAVDKLGNLQRVDKPITQPYSTTVENYSDMLSRTVTHAAYESGRAEGYKSQGMTKWRFVGPTDEKARPWHIALIGNVYEYGTPESDMALEVLSEPNCRHRAVPFFDDAKLDTPDSFFAAQKEKAGLAWKNGEWGFKE